MDDDSDTGGAQQELDRLTLLNKVGSALSSTLDAVERLRRVCRILVPELADWCVADLVDDQGALERVCISHRDPGTTDFLADLTGALPALPETATGPVSRVLHGAGPLLVRAAELHAVEAAADPLHAANLELFARLGADTLIVSPLRARRRVLGVLTVVRASGRPPLTEADVTLVENLTHRIALAVDNARLYAQTQAIAERLQRSLLPALPAVDDLRIEARYAPAAATAEVGGDWYDCFVLPDGDTALIIGDVTGHDLQAAVTMSQVRNMLRGIACDRQEPPGRIIRRLDLVIDNLYPHQTATCVYALLKRPAEGVYELQWARAGHPPPLLMTPDGATRYLQDAHGILLGLDPGAERPSARTRLPVGSTLLLYTDGLIERRGESLEHSMTRLRQHAAGLVDRHLGAFCDELLASLAPDPQDDIALLALRLLPPAG